MVRYAVANTPYFCTLFNSHSLVGLGIPEHRAQIYHDYVVDGDYLVIVDGTEAEILRAETIFKRQGMREWEVYNSPTISRSANPVVSRV